MHLQGGKHRGAATCFVSHTWQADAAGLLEAVIKHGDAVVANGSEAPVFYLDLASVDQHQTDQASSGESRAAALRCAALICVAPLAGVWEHRLSLIHI